MLDTLKIIHDTLSLTLGTDSLKVYNISHTSTDFKWTDYLKPSIDLLLALIGAFILIWKYLTQKQKEARERIIENKRNAYYEYLKDFTETALNITYGKEVEGIDYDRRRLNARNLLLLYGNDKVIKVYHEWVESD